MADPAAAINGPICPTLPKDADLHRASQPVAGYPTFPAAVASGTAITHTTQEIRAAGISGSPPTHGALAMDDEDPTIDTRPRTNAWAGPLPLMILLIVLLALALGTVAVVVRGTLG
jgi:hypothetical protein